MKQLLWRVTSLLCLLSMLGISLGADTRAITSLVGVTDSALSLKVLAVATSGVAGDTRAIGSLVGKTDSSGNLYVTLDSASVISGANFLANTSGTCVTPRYSFTGDTDTGIGYLGANNAAGCANGATSFDWNASRVQSAVDILPSANVTKHLGSLTAQWLDVFTDSVKSDSLRVGQTGLVFIRQDDTTRRGDITASADGVLLFRDSAQSSWGGFKLGGMTSAFPYIKKNGTGVDFRLADDSAYAPMAASTINATIGVQINGAAATGAFLRGDGTNFINSTLTLPNAATQGDLLTATGANVIGVVADVAAGSYLRSGGTSTVPAYSTTTLPNTVATGNFLIASGTNVVAAVTPAWATANPANQTGNATATLKMNGLGAAASACTITPAATGRVRFAIYGTIANTLTGDGVTYKLAYGTGTAPANGAAATGTILGVQQTWTALTGELNTLFHIEGIATGLTLSTATWFDLQLADVTGGTASAISVVCVAHEG